MEPREERKDGEGPEGPEGVVASVRERVGGRLAPPPIS